MQPLLDLCCEAIVAQEAFAEIPDAVAFCEDRFNPEALASQYASARLRVMLAVSAHRRSQAAGNTTLGELDLDAVILENPLLRARSGETRSLTDAALAVVSALHAKTFRFSRDNSQRLAFISYRQMQREDFSLSEYRMRVSFTGICSLLGECVAWGVGDGSALGFVTRSQFSRLGTTIFEPDRHGNDAFLGTRNRHWRINLSAAATTQDPSQLPQIGDTFSYRSVSYITEAASLALAVSSPATVSLQGRTLPGGG